MMYLGTVMKLGNGRALVFTLDCGLVYIKARESMFVGQQVSFHQADVFVSRKALLWSLPIAALAAAAAILVLLFATGVFAGLPAGPLEDTVAFVAVDINPSVELQVGADGNIIGVNTLNDDAKKLLAGMALKGTSVNAAVERLISASIAQGYLDPQTGLVMVAATINGKNTAVMQDASQYKGRLQSILQQISHTQGEKVFTLLIEDPDTKVMADQNGLSIGRELLREFALKNNIELPIDEIKNGKIGELILKLGCEDPDELNPSPTPGVPESPVPTKSNEPSNKPSDTPKPKDETGVRVKIAGSGVKVMWDKPASGEGFQHYKIVASRSNASPRYPEDGYAKAISNINTTSAVIGANTSYTGGDIGGRFVPGQKYWFSVTCVYADHYEYGNSVSVTWPKADEPTPTPAFSPHMSASVDAEGELHVSWNKLSSSSLTYDGETYTGFLYYKVVASESDPRPIYPSGLIDRPFGIKTGSASFCAYDVGMVGGHSYYVSVTYVFEGGRKIAANAVNVSVPLAPEVPEFTSPHMSASVDPEGILHVSWTKLPASTVTYGGKTYTGFLYYKVVASTSPNPVYPSKYINDPHSIGAGSDDYNVSSYGWKPGESYYISVTYVFGNGSIAANDVRVTIPGGEDPPPEG